MWVTVQAGFETVLSGHCWTSSCAFEQRWCMFYLSVTSLSCFCKTCFCLNRVTLCSWDTSEYVTIYSNIPARMLCQMRRLMFLEQISGVWLESACSCTNLTVPQIVRVLLFQNNVKWSPIKKKMSCITVQVHIQWSTSKNWLNSTNRVFGFTNGFSDSVDFFLYALYWLTQCTNKLKQVSGSFTVGVNSTALCCISIY